MRVQTGCGCVKIVVCVLVMLMFAGVGSAFSVELEVKERAGVGRISEPVTSGVPLAESEGITSINVLRILDDTSTEIPAQFRVLSRYNGIVSDTTKPIRVVLVDFQIDVAAGQTKTVTLCDGGSGTTPGNDLLSIDGNNVSIVSGGMNGGITNHTGTLSHVMVDGKDVLGTTTSDGWLVKSVGGAEYSSWNDDNTVIIEENGPLRAVARVNGSFKDSLGVELVPEGADNGLSYTIRYVFFKNKSVMKAYPRLENENNAWRSSLSQDPIHCIHINYSYFKTSANISDAHERADFGGDIYTGRENYSLHINEVSDGSTQTYDWSRKVNGGTDSGDEYESYAAVNDSYAGVMIGERWFWQNHPKQYRFDDGGDVVYMDLWTDESDNPRGVMQADPSGNHRIMGGMWKTHELVYHFTDGLQITDFGATMASLQYSLKAIANSTYYSKSKFFYTIPPANTTVQSSDDFDFGDVNLSDIVGYDDKYRQAKINISYIEDGGADDIISYRDGRKIPGNGSPAYWSWYGIVEFGDFPRGGSTWGYSGAHYGWDYHMMVSALRYTDYDYMEFAEELATHRADIIIMHDTPAYLAATTEAQWHGANRYEWDALLSFNNTKSQSFNTNPRDGSHLWYRGIALQYLLTGEERYMESLEDVKEGRDYVYFDLWDCETDCSNAATRAIGRSMGAYLTYYIVTGDEDSLNKAYYLFSGGILPDEVNFGNGSYWTNIIGVFDSGVLQPSITTQYLIYLYPELVGAGKTSEADTLKTSLHKQSMWLDETVFGGSWYSCSDGYDAGDFGTGAHSGEYLPYMHSKMWDADAPWICGSFLEVYMLPYQADLFAFQYEQGRGDAWLNKSRNMYKDWILYGACENWETTKTALPPTSGLPGIGESWAKSGQYLMNGMYYMDVEYAYSQGVYPFMLDVSKAYYNAANPIQNSVTLTGHVWNRTITANDDECAFTIEVTI